LSVIVKMEIIDEDTGITKNLEHIFCDRSKHYVNSELEIIGRERFKNVGDEGLFPNHSDKDIWLNGFVNGAKWLMDYDQKR
jgi:hypothetical protein